MWHLKTKQQGMILPIVLIFMQIFILLSLFALESGRIQLKISLALWQKELFSEKTQEKLQQIENTLPTQCVVSPIPEESLSEAPLSWWQAQSCADKTSSIEYYYIIESLGEDVCAVLDSHHIADYYRVSLIGLDPLSGAIRRLQTTYVSAISPWRSCVSHSHVVALGRQSWREF